jgi:hypothetical protein
MRLHSTSTRTRTWRHLAGSRLRHQSQTSWATACPEQLPMPYLPAISRSYCYSSKVPSTVLLQSFLSPHSLFILRIGGQLPLLLRRSPVNVLPSSLCQEGAVIHLQVWSSTVCRLTSLTLLLPRVNLCAKGGWVGKLLGGWASSSQSRSRLRCRCRTVVVAAGDIH